MEISRELLIEWRRPAFEILGVATSSLATTGNCIEEFGYGQIVDFSGFWQLLPDC